MTEQDKLDLELGRLVRRMVELSGMDAFSVTRLAWIPKTRAWVVETDFGLRGGDTPEEALRKALEET